MAYAMILAGHDTAPRHTVAPVDVAAHAADQEDGGHVAADEARERTKGFGSREHYRIVLGGGEVRPGESSDLVESFY
jgi:hypothetical protein